MWRCEWIWQTNRWVSVTGFDSTVLTTIRCGDSLAF